MGVRIWPMRTYGIEAAVRSSLPVAVLLEDSEVYRWSRFSIVDLASLSVDNACFAM